MRLTDEIWKQLGFTKKTSNGGYERWYHNKYLGRDFICGGGISISKGYLSFDCESQNNPKTLKELYTIMEMCLFEGGKQMGEIELQGKLQSLLGLED